MALQAISTTDQWKFALTGSSLFEVPSDQPKVRFEMRTMESATRSIFDNVVVYVHAPTGGFGHVCGLPLAANRLHSLVTDLQRGSVVRPAPELGALLTKVVQMRGIPTDVDGWAKRLSEESASIKD